MPPEKLGNLLAAIGNHEAKALVLAAMRPGIVYSAGDLRRLLLEPQARSPVWRISSGVAFDYCRYSLSPFGLVTQELLDTELRSFGYMKSQYGEYVGDAFAGYLLAFSLTHSDVSLVDLFGTTNSSAVPQAHPNEVAKTADFRIRSPLRRYRMITELLRNRLPMRETDLAAAVGEPVAALSPHLQRLHDLGIIMYRSTRISAPYALFRVRDDHSFHEVPLHPHSPSLSRELHSLLARGQIFTREQLATTLIRTFPRRATLRQTTLRTSISQILSRFEKYGCVERVRFTASRQSDIDLTSGQRRLLNDLVEAIEIFARQGPSDLTAGRTKAARIVNDPSKFTALLDKARRASSSANRWPLSELGDAVERVARTQPYSGIADIQLAIREVYGRNVSPQPIKQVVRFLRDRARIRLAEQQVSERPHRYCVAGALNPTAAPSPAHRGSGFRRRPNPNTNRRSPAC
jgi:hypothetical protein